LEDERIEVAQVGPAAEAGVLFSAIISMSNRANGRTGMGAVMASKNLKAIVVRGKQGKKRFKVANDDALLDLVRRGAAALPESDVVGLSKYGTAEVTGIHNAIGMLPSRNFSSGVFEGAEAIDGPTMYETILRGAAEGKQNLRGRDTCYGCVIRCKRVVEIDDEGPFQVDPRYGGPEYETIAAFGSYCGVSDLAAVAKANEICNKYGMDTISCGATIAWAMECFEDGKITTQDTGGIELKFGNAEAMVRVTELIARREGFGQILSLGSERAAELIGRGTDEYLVTSHRQEAPAHMPHGKRSLALIYAVNPFGADHQSSEHDPFYEKKVAYPERLGALGLTEAQPRRSLGPEKVRFARITQYFYSLMDSVNVCQFVYGPAWQLYGPQELRDMIHYVTGWDVTIEELLQVGERRLNMMRAFNAREGIDREQDKLPEKMFKKALKGGASDGVSLERDQFEAALDEYYRQNDWDVETGIPTRYKLEELGLSWVADELNL
jgi:aldehyde:ferredoxin oxidoreductase